MGYEISLSIREKQRLKIEDLVFRAALLLVLGPIQANGERVQLDQPVQHVIYRTARRDRLFSGGAQHQ